MKHDENCDVNDVNPDGIKKPCNCGASFAQPPCSEFPAGFTGDMEALHKHHQSQVAKARRELEAAKKEVERWERLEAASSTLAIVAMHRRWAHESNTPNAASEPRQGGDNTTGDPALGAGSTD